MNRDVYMYHVRREKKQLDDLQKECDECIHKNSLSRRDLQAENAVLKAENETLRLRLLLFKCNDCELKEENESLRKQFRLDDAAIKSCNEALAIAGNELDMLRKAIWHLEKVFTNPGWFISDHVATMNNLDIAELQKDMGK